MRDTEAAIAANRLGLGARPGDLAQLRNGAREALLAQLSAPPPVLEEASLQSSQELLVQAFARRQAQGGSRAGSAPDAAAVARSLREIYRPAYVADAQARFRHAVATGNGFVERLVHFWSNHFAVSVDKLVVLGIAGTMEREAIRPHVFGTFDQMLLAVEQHPAMLLYLDNQMSIGPNSQAARMAGRRGQEAGLNENLGREILELHTLGVDGGYSQQDVRALATLITGWTIGGGGGLLRDGDPGSFHFRAAYHEPGEQRLLGHRYREDGLEQGRSALKDLAVHQATARHLATKLARHFIADEPATATVHRLEQAWLKSGGDLPTVYRALLESPEAWGQPLAKYKTPADYIHSAWRALQLPAGTAMRDLNVFEELGQRMFQPGSPAGWPDRSADWDGSAALMKRLEWAQAAGQRLGSQRDALALAQDCLGATWSVSSSAAVARAQDAAQALTLLLSSPEFMRR